MPAGLASQPMLRRFAGPWSLWGLAISVVITSEFSGWNTGLLEGGFGGMLVATILMSVLYLAMSLSLAELAASMPHTGAAYSYVRIAFGPLAGCAAGLAQILEYTLAGAAVVVGLGSYVRLLALQLGLDIPDVAWWVILYVLFIALNIHSVVTLFRIAIVLAVVALLALAFFWVTALPAFDLSLALDIVPAAGGSTWLPNGLIGVAWAIPFAIWFYLSVEAVALASEETEEPARSVPRGLFWGIVTLIVAAITTLVINSGLPPGAAAIGEAEEPLLLALSQILGEGKRPILLAVIGIAGQAASFHAMIYAYGRSIYAMGRAGYLPAVLATVHKTRRTPHVALIVGGVIGFLVALLGKFAPQEVRLDALLIAMAVLAAVFAYILQMLAFLKLRRAYPNMARPYRSPFGATGAMTALVIAVAALIFMAFETTLLPGFYGSAAAIAAGLIYFVLFARHRLYRSPEEAAAVRIAETGADTTSAEGGRTDG